MKKKNKKTSGILIEFCSLLKHNKVPKNTSFLQKWKYKHHETKSTHAFFSDQKVKAHTPTFILFVKLCKKPI